MYGMWAVALMAQAAAAVEGDSIAFDDEHLSLMQLRAHKHDTQKQMADGCGNVAGGYACTAGAFGVSRVQVLRDLGCRGDPDLWSCSVAAAKVACDADATCNSFGVCAKWGLNMAQLFGGVDGTPNADWNLWVVAEPEADVAAVGDPHITTISGDHSDMCCENGTCKPCSH